MITISVLGCGWLGLPLAKSLISTDVVVKGTTTTESKLDSLKDSGIDAYLIDINENGIIGDLQKFLENAEILIINIPKIKSNGSYPARMEALVPFIEAEGIPHVLFVSSTSVYGDDGNLVTEATLPNPQTNSGKQVLDAERVFYANPNFSTAIIRFGGLIGNDRHPVYHLAGRNNVENPNAPINLIHQNDCIGLISAVIRHNAWGKIFNGVAPYHPSRQEYYHAKALQIGLTPPEFAEDNSPGKIISSKLAEDVLGYVFTDSYL